MPYNNRGDTTLQSQELAYDLRQIYAKIVGRNLDLVDLARFNKDYPAYFKALEDLYTIVKHKFKKCTQKEKKKTTYKNYKTLRDNFIKLANKYRQAYINKSCTKGNEVAEIDTALRAMEMYLYNKMDKEGMFGKKEVDEGMF